MTEMHKLILFLIGSDTGVKDVHSMIRFYHRLDFRLKLTEYLNYLLSSELIVVTKYYDDKITPNAAIAYDIAQKGIDYIIENFDDAETIKFIKTFEDHDFVLKITQAYIDKKNRIVQ